MGSKTHYMNTTSNFMIVTSKDIWCHPGKNNFKDISTIYTVKVVNEKIFWC